MIVPTKENHYFLWAESGKPQQPFSSISIVVCTLTSIKFIYSFLIDNFFSLVTCRPFFSSFFPSFFSSLSYFHLFSFPSSTSPSAFKRPFILSIMKGIMALLLYFSSPSEGISTLYSCLYSYNLSFIASLLSFPNSSTLRTPIQFCYCSTSSLSSLLPSASLISCSRIGFLLCFLLLSYIHQLYISILFSFPIFSTIPPFNSLLLFITSHIIHPPLF